MAIQTEVETNPRYTDGLDMSHPRNMMSLMACVAEVVVVEKCEFRLFRLSPQVQGGWGGWPTGNGKKLSYSQACCLAQLCLAAA